VRTLTESSAIQPPGWYYAQGDPAGTQRYWDGSQWVGGPQAVASAVAPGGYGAQAFTGAGNPAEYGSRVVAYLIDVGIVFGGYVVVFVLGLILGSISDALGGLVLLLGLLGLLGFVIWNMIIQQGSTGQTIGKKQQNIRLINLATGQPPGAGGAFLRWLLASAISGVTCGIGGIADLLWPLWDENKQRLTDKIMKYHVVNV
jgi:uncharacterized RDD family membrane protein YckC